MPPDQEEAPAWPSQSGQGAERDSWSLVRVAKQEQERTEDVILNISSNFFSHNISLNNKLNY